MIKQILELLESKYALIASGLCLVFSLALSLTKADIIFDPAIITVALSGFPILYSAVYKLIHKKGISKISSALLISVAMIASIYIGELFAAGEVAFIMALGELLEEMTTKRAKRGLKKLMEIAPEKARRINGGKEETVRAEELNEKDIIRILPGEKIPADCIIIKGETSVDQSVLTGESLPVDKSENDELFCGTVNCFGTVDAVVSKTGEDNSLQKLIRLVKEAENKKAPMERTADKWASILVPIALLIAICAYFIPPFDIERAVTVLVVFCPCALVLATPTAIMASIGQAAKHGVVIKSGEALENMGKADIIAFDKTGTLTNGTPEVCDIISFTDERSLLEITAAVERSSTHPLAKSFLKYAEQNNIDKNAIAAEHFLTVSGKGVTALVSGSTVLCGNEKFIRENHIAIPKDAEIALEKLNKDGKSSVLTSSDGKLLGIISFSDTPRKDAYIITEKLNRQNVKTVLLTGDNINTASFFARQVPLSEIKAGLLPSEKMEAIEAFRSSGHTVCMIGDGVNDAPALKTADIGIAMGGAGSDIASESSDIVLMADDISKIPYLKHLAGATVKTIKFGIFLSLFINFAAIILSLLNVLDPVTGALVHNAGSFLVIFIAALLYDRKFE